jgi:hypothetical protein
MDEWTLADLLPGLYVSLLAAGLAAALRRWYDPVPARVLAIFGLLLALLLGPVLFGGGVLLPLGNLPGHIPYRYLPPSDPPSIGLQSDLVVQIAPWQLQVRRALGEGRWPLWNSLAGAGMPLLGDPQSQSFQPLIVAAYPFDLWRGVGITAALRILLALVFLFLLLRRQGLGAGAALCGSLAYGLGGFLLFWLGWPLANCAALLPAVLYAIVRCDEEGGARDFLLLSLALAGLLLAGHPEAQVYSLALAGLFALARAWRRRWEGAGRLLARYGLAAALAGGFAAPVLLPILDYLPKSHRSYMIAYHLAPRPLGELWAELGRPETLAFWRERAAERLLPTAAPRAFGDHFSYWGSGNLFEDASGFAGSAALLAAALTLTGRRCRFPQERLMTAVLLGSLLLLAQPPGFDRLAGRLPLAGPTAIHQHQRLLLLVVLSLAYLAACEVERRARGEGSRWVVPAVAAALAGLVAWVYLTYPSPENPELLAEFRQGWLRTHLLVLTGAAVLLTFRGKRWIPWAFGVLLAVELLPAHGPYVRPAPRRLAYPETPPLRFLQSHLGDSRFLGLGRGILPPNFASVHGLNDVRVDNPALPAGYIHTTHPLLRRSPVPVLGRPEHPIYDLLSVRYVMTRPGVDIPLLKLVFRDKTGWIYERPRRLPRLFLPRRAVEHDGGLWAEWLDRNPNFAVRALVQGIPKGKRAWKARRPPESSLAVTLPEPGRVHAQGRLAERRLLASSVFQDGHWRLLVNGEPRPVFFANGPFVAAWLPRGDRRIELLYRPRPFLAGCLLAALSLAGAAVWWVPPPGRMLSSSHGHRRRPA